VLEDLRHGISKNGGVALQQVHPRFPRLLPDTGAEQDNAALGQILVFAGVHVQRMRERYGMADIVCLGLGASGVLIYQDQFPSHALHHQGVARG
jgi:hypothetical protein